MREIAKLHYLSRDKYLCHRRAADRTVSLFPLSLSPSLFLILSPTVPLSLVHRPRQRAKPFSIHITHIALRNHEVYIKKYSYSKALLILLLPRFVFVFSRVPEFKMSTRLQSPLSEGLKNNTNSSLQAEF